MFKTHRPLAVLLALASVLVMCATASAKPILMSTLQQTIQNQRAAAAQGITPPPPPCIEWGTPLYSDGGCTPIPEAPATTLPYPGNMTYYGGHVMTSPHLYLVYWGWGETNAWKGWPNADKCAPTTISETTKTSGTTYSGTLACDVDGAGQRMADFVNQMGGTSWAGTQTQYFQQDSSGSQTPVGNSTDQLSGIWVDDSNTNTLPATNMNNAAGPTNTLTVLGQEAQRAAEHFGVSGAGLDNAQFLIIQPPGLSDPNALSQGYCAFHDYTWPNIWSNVYNGITQGISYTNMPYQLAINSGGVNVCGENAVNAGDAGKLDGYSIVLGHEIEETTTDPGAEDVIPDSAGNPKYLGGWYDTIDANENGDKCAWVGENLLTGQEPVLPVPGSMGDIKGNQGGTFPVQSLWSNSSAAGAGWCAGAGTDLPTDSATSAAAAKRLSAKRHAKRTHRTHRRALHRSAKRA